MSVYTSVSPAQLRAFLHHYSIGQLVDFQGIADGIENSNYFVTTTAGKFVLTLFEKLTACELDYFLDLQHHLAQQAIPCPTPIRTNNQQTLLTLNNKPAALFRCLPGKSTTQANREQCAAVGTMLARLHRAGQNFKQTRQNPKDLVWMQQVAEQLLPKLNSSQIHLLTIELAYQHQSQAALDKSCLPAPLPVGLLHADLFKDNLLFEGNRITGILDFYDACSGVLVYDLAITVNDWCSAKDGTLITQYVETLLGAYQKERALTQVELAAWPQMLRLGALRFWLSRLENEHNPQVGEITQIKPAATFENILSQHIRTIIERDKLVDNFVD
ncbi:MAG: homoserine kinase [Gammaproteobacteria bacterium]|nr:homoserine kinase [Gammaproteobacteria bacterium]